MSLSYCGECERVVEGSVEYFFDEEAQCEVEICGTCGHDTTTMPEDDPKEDR